MCEFKLGEQVFLHTQATLSNLIANGGPAPIGPGHIIAIAEDGWYKVHRPWHLGGVWARAGQLSRITEE